ncbi:MAG: hypothetical protein RMH97_04690, partial [Verrucomicrobiales bacterium]|nr:hypothetical protein [Verrucomicrobiales bacterium]
FCSFGPRHKTVGSNTDAFATLHLNLGNTKTSHLATARPEIITVEATETGGETIRNSPKIKGSCKPHHPEYAAPASAAHLAVHKPTHILAE